MKTTGILLAVGFLLGGGVIQAHAFNMTGTWKGTWTCRVQHDGTATTIANQASVMKITQVGPAVHVDLDNGEFHYSGGARTDNENADRGAATVVECRTNPKSAVYNEVISAEVKAPSGAKNGEFNGTSAYNSTENLLGCSPLDPRGCPSAFNSTEPPLSEECTWWDPRCDSALNFPDDVSTDIGGICRYTFKRVSSDNPGVGACPSAP